MALAETPSRTFPSPFELATPPGAEGWETMFPYFALFRSERREAEENRFWFYNGMHFPEPIYPFDMITADYPYRNLGQANTRIYALPPALGIDHRVVNGYIYMSVNGVADPAEIGRRAEVFTKRAGYYFQHWDELYARWETKVKETIADVEALQVPKLQALEPEEPVLAGRGLGATYDLLLAFNRLIESFDRVWQYHFEFLNLGYAAYLTFYQQCKQAFPGIVDQSIAKMVSGIDVVLFRPDAELKRLARAAIDLGIADVIKAQHGSSDLVEVLSRTDSGKEWLADLERTKQPWFNFSYGNGFYHHHRSWVDNMSLPLATIAGYIERLQRGENIDRPTEEVQRERDRITSEYQALLQTDADRQTFAQTLGLARTVFPYVESHNFFVEHWYHTLFWNKVREFGALLVEHRFFDEADDVFYLNRHEVWAALEDLMLGWAAGSEARGPGYWPPIVARRKEIMQRLREWTPPPALGPAPDAIEDPMTILLWGVTNEQLENWLRRQSGQAEAGELSGCAGSPGVVEGPARVLNRPDQLDELRDGEILVCPVTSPSWTPVFGRIKAAVSDIGGIMSHAAIVAREYGLPAVVGTGFGTTTIKTGQRIRVDGNRGVVTILD